MKRISSIDITRGIVMVIMAIDHVRDLIHVDSLTQNPTNLETTTPILFFTRFVTHLCAPTFVFLAGTSAYLGLIRSDEISKFRNFLFKRGIWLIVLEFTLVMFGIFFDIGFHSIMFEVIATIGFGFILLGFLLNFSSRKLGTVGLLIIFCHNLLPIIPLADDSILKTILTPLFGFQVYPISQNHTFFVAYPPLTWFGIMLLGFSFGEIFSFSEEKRKAILLYTGVLSLMLFAILRFSNIYGDPLKWQVQKTNLFSFLSFINVTKYPPSLFFCLISLGIMFFILRFAENLKGKIAAFLSVYGKVPMFYFLVHFYFIHIILLTILFLQGFSWNELAFATGTFGRPSVGKNGLELWAIYLIWVFVVLSLYLPCKWFGKLKSEQRFWWLKYF